MSAQWYVAACVLLVGGIAPGIIVASQGSVARRLVGLQLVSTATPLVVITMALAYQEPLFLIAALVAVLMAFTGTLVFTRLLGRS
ncbi:MAG: hypothetical protein IRZ02_06845 [Acidothermus sp.]|nr:hypothetical protein [Acidothermus sp.]MCL6538504.1 hypothetical protein [Acidothermus sp.]